MFGTNEKAGKQHFSKLEPNQLMVTSMFYTLQGEGPYRGQPAFFIRLAKCNLDCSFCDTYFDSGTVMTFDEIFTAIEYKVRDFFDTSGSLEKSSFPPRWAQFMPGYEAMKVENIPPYRGYVTIGDQIIVQNKKREMVLVITGGEPALQDNLKAFLEEAQHQFTHTQIESNGTAAPPVVDSTTVVISPKCLEVNGKAIRYLKPNKTALERADCLKFVMEARPTGPAHTESSADGSVTLVTDYPLSPYSEIPDWAHEWWRQTGKPIYVSPINVYRQEPKRAKELRAAKQESEITLEERSTYDEVISFWEPGLLDMEANRRNHEHAAQYAIKHGFIFNVQIHLLASLA